MIKEHHMLNSIDDKSIEEAAERVGFEHFIPKTLVRHLTHACMYYLTDNNAELCIEETTTYTQSFRELIQLINFDRMLGISPLDSVLLLLKSVHGKVNLRRAEYSACNGYGDTLEFNIDPANDNQNYAVDLTSIPEIVLDVLDIEAHEDTNKTVLSEESLKILGFYDGFTSTPGTTVTREERKYEQISSFNQITKVRKYKYSLPSFKAELALKKHIIKKTDLVTEDKEDIILAIDCNLMSKRDELEFLAEAVLLHYLTIFDNNKITYHEFSRFLLHEAHITSAEELIALYLRKRERHLALYPTTNALNQLGSKYTGKNIVIVSPGDATFKLERNRGNIFHGVSFKENESLRKVCISSGGSYSIL